MPLAFIFSSPPHNMPYTLHVYAHFVWISIYGSVVVRYVWCSSTSDWNDSADCHWQKSCETHLMIVFPPTTTRCILTIFLPGRQCTAVDFLEFKKNTLYNFGHSDMVKINCIKWAEFKIWYTFLVCNHISNIFEIKIRLNFHIF